MLYAFWTNFQNHFKAGLEVASFEDLSKAWDSEKSRTTYYKNMLADHVANAMGLEIVPELFKVDFMLGKRSGDSFVPLIFIESENKPETARHEMQKLCCLSAPLKVLITCVQWCEAPGYWKHGGDKSRLMQKWTSIISEHHRIWAQPCIYGVIVGEWNRNQLRFYANTISVDGKAGDEIVLFERKFDAAS